jgi:hypothetical protein
MGSGAAVTTRNFAAERSRHDGGSDAQIRHDAGPDQGKLVEIPEEGLGNVTTQKTIRDRKHERIVEKSAIGWNLALKEIKPQVSEWD